MAAPRAADGDRLLRWCAAAPLAGALLLGADFLRVDRGVPDPLSASAYALSLGAIGAGVATPVLLLLYLLRRRLGGVAAGLALGALLALPTWDQVHFLTEGDHISTSAHLPWVRGGMLTAALLCYLGAWWWHLRGVEEALAPRWLRRLLPRWSREICWALWGATALLLLAHVLDVRLRAYVYAARALLPAALLIAATLLFRALSLLRAPRWLCGGLCLGMLALGVGGARLGKVERVRHEALRRGRMAAHADLWVHSGEERHASIDLRSAAGYDCPAPSPAPAPRKRGAHAKHVILISIDALRRDALGWEHEDRPLMPALHTFAAESRLYTRAVTTYPATLLAMGGALTGMGPSDLLLSPRLPPNVFELAHEAFDVHVALLPQSRWFKLPVIEPLLVQRARLLRFEGAHAQVAALERTLRRAKRRRRRVLSWIHLYEPHAPYERHRDFERGEGDAGRYRSELAYLDSALERLFSFLEQEHFLDETLVVVMSDHGEALGELDYTGHHVYLNAWIADIPLMVRAPGLAAGEVTAMADLTDVAATVLDFAGVPRPPAMIGRSLLGAPATLPSVRIAEAFPLRGVELFDVTRKPVRDLGELAKRLERVQRGARNYLPKVAAVSSTHRLVVNRVTGVTDLYDRATDPEELEDLGGRGLLQEGILREALDRWTRNQARRLYCGVVTPAL